MFTSQPVHFLGSLTLVRGQFVREVRSGVFAGMIDTCGGREPRWLVSTAEGPWVVRPSDVVQVRA